MISCGLAPEWWWTWSREARHAGQRPSTTGPAHCAQIRCSQLIGTPSGWPASWQLPRCKALSASFPLDCSLLKSGYPHVAQVGGGSRVHQASHVHIYIAVMGL